MRSHSLKLPKHLSERLELIAKSRGVSRSLVIREALEAYIVPKDSALARAGDLVGSLKGGPRDLATNPKHMKGYGE